MKGTKAKTKRAAIFARFAFRNVDRKSPILITAIPDKRYWGISLTTTLKEKVSRKIIDSTLFSIVIKKMRM